MVKSSMRASARKRPINGAPEAQGEPETTKKGGGHARKQLDDESRERGPRIDSTAKAQLRMALMVCSDGKEAGGIEKTIRECLEAPEAVDGAMTKLRASLLPEVFVQWQAVVRFWHLKLQRGPDGGLHPTIPTDEIKKRAVALRRQLPSDEKAMLVRAESVTEKRKRGVHRARESSTDQNWVAAVGKWESNHPNTPDGLARATGEATIPVWKPATKGCRVSGLEVVGRRGYRYRPTDPQQMEQLCNVRSWRLRRVLRILKTEDAFFTIGGMTKLIGNWREEHATDRVPPVRVLVKRCHALVLPMMLCSETGHVWSVADCGPIDEVQMLQALESKELVEAVRELLHMGLSASMLRSLAGQGTHGGATRVAIQRMMQRVRHRSRVQHPWNRGVGMSIGAVASGMGLTALQVAGIVGGNVTWMAEGQRTAYTAGEQMMLMAGHVPTMFRQAEDARLAHRRWGVAIEVITLACAPFSQAGNGKKVEKALRELREVLAGTAARRPRTILYETTAGLWRTPDVRARLEAILQQMAGYEWEVAKVSPHRHCGVGVRRERVFYMAVRRDVRLIDAEEAIEAAPAVATAAMEDGEGMCGAVAGDGRAATSGHSEAWARTCEMMLEDDVPYLCGTGSDSMQAVVGVTDAVARQRRRPIRLSDELMRGGETTGKAPARRVALRYRCSPEQIPAFRPARSAQLTEVEVAEPALVPTQESDQEVRRMRQEGRRVGGPIRWTGILRQG